MTDETTEDAGTRDEAAEDHIREQIRRGAGCITWWPGGPSHDTIARMVERGELVTTDVSGSQETKFEVRFAPKRPADTAEWQPLETAPRNATWFIGRRADGSEIRAHWASDLSGEEQPPFEGFFARYGDDVPGFWQVDDLEAWRPETIAEARQAR